MNKRQYLPEQSILDRIIDYLYKTTNLNDEITTPEIELKYNSLDQFNMSNPIFKQIINDFIITLKKHFPEEYLNNFYNNINELKIRDKKLKGLNGQYKIDKNEIYIRNNMKVSDIRGVLYHELFHMASSAYKKGRRYSGFSQRTKSRKKVIGNGINEGYTELLAHRYCEERFDVAYVEECNIVLCLETIIGKEEMSKLYFNANLRGLIDRLQEYSNESDIIRFILSVDSLQKYYSEIITEMEFKHSLNIAYIFLLKTYIKKQEKEYKENNITIDEFIDRIAEYIFSLKLVSSSSKETTYSLEMKNILRTVLEDCTFKERINQKIYSIYTERYNN